MDLEARFMFLANLEFVELGCLVETIGAELFFNLKLHELCQIPL